MPVSGYAFADGRRRSLVALTLRSALVGPSSAGPGPNAVRPYNPCRPFAALRAGSQGRRYDGSPADRISGGLAQAPSLNVCDLPKARLQSGNRRDFRARSCGSDPSSGRRRLVRAPVAVYLSPPGEGKGFFVSAKMAPFQAGAHSGLRVFAIRRQRTTPGTEETRTAKSAIRATCSPSRVSPNGASYLSPGQRPGKTGRSHDEDNRTSSGPSPERASY